MGKAVLGAILLVIGVLITIGGALTAATFGPSGTLQTTSTPLSTTRDGYALVADVVGVSAGFPGSDLLGSPTLGADSPGTERLFVGIGSRQDVDEYLAGVAFQAVRQDGGSWESLSIPGGRKPGVASDETFWFRASTGNAPTIDFATSNGTGTFVVMHADGTPDVSARILIGYTSKWVFPLAIAAIVLGVLLVIEGIVLLRRSRRGTPANPTDTDTGADTEADSGAVPATSPGALAAPDAQTTVLDPVEPVTTAPPAPPAHPTADDPAATDDVPDEWFRGPGAS